MRVMETDCAAFAIPLYLFIILFSSKTCVISHALCVRIDVHTYDCVCAFSPQFVSHV